HHIIDVERPSHGRANHSFQTVPRATSVSHHQSLSRAAIHFDVDSPCRTCASGSRREPPECRRNPHDSIGGCEENQRMAQSRIVLELFFPKARHSEGKFGGRTLPCPAPCFPCFYRRLDAFVVADGATNPSTTQRCQRRRVRHLYVIGAYRAAAKTSQMVAGITSWSCA